MQRLHSSIRTFAALALGTLLLASCGGGTTGPNCNALTKKRAQPQDAPTQPAFDGTLLAASADADADGAPDFFDSDPESSSQRSPSPDDETEFNNNIQVANPIAGSLPLLLRGSLANGDNYVVDSDYYAIQGKAGTRTGIWVFAGAWQSSEHRVELQENSTFSPNVAVVDSDGRRLNGQTFDIAGVGSYIGVVFANDATYYVEVSDLDITSTTYSFDYTVWIDKDQDFDGLRDTFETHIGTDPESADSDDDENDDFFESYWFVEAQRSFIPSDNVWDQDNDGIPNAMDVDSDGDGIADQLETVADHDSDGTPNFLDHDSNDDGISDRDQAGDSFAYPSDQDRDGTPDYLDDDVDGDGIANPFDQLEKPDGDACSLYVKQSSGNIYDQGALRIGGVFGKPDGGHLPDMAVPGASLLVLGSGFSETVEILIPTKSGTKSLKPTSIDEAGTQLRVKVPDGARTGELYAVDGARVSNRYDVQVAEAGLPLITSVQPDAVESGATIEIRGRNLNGGRTEVAFAGLRAMTMTTLTSAYPNVLTLNVPFDAPSGEVYVIVNDAVSNRLPLLLQRQVSLSVSLPPKTRAGEDGYLLTTALDDADFTGLDYAGELSAEVGDHDFAAAFGFAKKNETPYLVYDAIIFPDDTSVELNARSTALKAVFTGLGYLVTQPQANWTEIRNIIEGLPEFTAMAETIDARLAKDPTAMAAFEDKKIVKAYQALLAAASDAVAAVGQSSGGFAPVVPEFDPSDEQQNIYLYPIKEADIQLQNDTKLYMSAHVVANDGTDIRKHITHPWSSNLIAPQGWGLLLISSAVDFPVGGRDSTIEVATSGVGSPRPDAWVHGYLVSRLVLDGLALPLFNEVVLKKLLGKKLRSKDAAEILIDLLGPQTWNGIIQSIINDPKNMPRTLKKKVFDVIWDSLVNSCLQFPPGTTCQKFAGAIAARLGIDQERVIKLIAKRVAIIVAQYLTPVVQEVVAAWDGINQINTWGSMALSLGDMLGTSGKVDFTLDYPLQIDDVKPACYVRPNDQPDRAPPMLITGKGFQPVPDGALWWKKDVYPEVSIAGEPGNITTVKTDGSSMLVKWPDANFSDGDYNVVVKHQGQEVESEQGIKLVSDGIYLEQLSPAEGPTGSRITLEGCGFSKVASENIVRFASSDDQPAIGVVVSANETALTVIVPDNAETGDVTVQVGSRKSGALEFTVEEANVTITYGDCGAANDDTFALYVDGGLASSMAAPARPFPVNVNLASGNHTVSMVGITAPDDVGTYCISFSGNVEVLGGAGLSGDDMTAGVRRSWQIKVNAGSSGGGVIAKPEHRDIEGLIRWDLPG